MSGNENLLSELLLTFAVWVLIITAGVGVALGIGLNINSAWTLRFLKATNRRISLRKSLKPLEASRDIDKAVFKRRRWSATFFILGGGYTIFMLLFVVEFPYVVVALSKYARPVIVEILVDSVKWLLLLGSALAIVVGGMMLASDSTSTTIQSRLNRWYSTRKFAKAGNEMHMTLDNLAEAYPRITGLVLASLSAFALVTALVVWIGD